MPASFFESPLAERCRPRQAENLLGQEKIWSKGSHLWNLVEKDLNRAVVFWGPPGTGKTTLAGIISHQTKRKFVTLSAVQAGVKDIRAVISESLESIKSTGKTTILFLDEIHRLSKNQQDVLLPALEKGEIKFIGATTENPSFEVNKAILSRVLVFRFEAMSRESLIKIMARAIANPKASLKHRPVSPEALNCIAKIADGDTRRALNILEAVIEGSDDKSLPIEVEDLVKMGLDQITKYDKQADSHFDAISAMIKSVRGSHPDAAVYYLARMIDAGEDPMFIARRLVILASEDVGNANPTALMLATNAMQAVHMVGYPEARIILAQVVTYLAASPKSNRSYEAIESALSDVRTFGSLEIPLQLRNAVTSLMKEFDYGKGYAYAHSDFAKAKTMKYLPEELQGKKYYKPSHSGVEKQLAANLEKLRPEAD